MSKIGRTWMLVSDGSRARVFELAPRGRTWTLVLTLEHAPARAHDRDLVTARRGRSQQSCKNTYNSGLEKGSAHREESKKFAREIAALLDRGRSEARYDRLVLVASPRFLGMLHQLLSPAVRASIAMQLARDYTQAPVQEISDRVGQVFSGREPAIGRG